MDVTLAMIENNLAIRVVCVVVSSVSVRRPALRQGWRRWGGMGRRGIVASPPGTGLQRPVGRGRDTFAGGCLRTAGVLGVGLKPGYTGVPDEKGVEGAVLTHCHALLGRPFAASVSLELLAL